MTYSISGARVKIGGQTFVSIVDEQNGNGWAYIPFSDRTQQEFFDTYRDARIVRDALNAAAAEREGSPSTKRDTSSDAHAYPEQGPAGTGEMGQ